MSSPNGGWLTIKTSNRALRPFGTRTSTQLVPQHLNGSPLIECTVTSRERYPLQHPLNIILSVQPVSISTFRCCPSTKRCIMGSAPLSADREPTPALTRRPRCRFPSFLLDSLEKYVQVLRRASNGEAAGDFQQTTGTDDVECALPAPLPPWSCCGHR